MTVLTVQSFLLLQEGQEFRMPGPLAGIDAHEDVVWTVTEKDDDNELVRLSAAYFGIELSPYVVKKQGDKLLWVRGK